MKKTTIRRKWASRLLLRLKNNLIMKKFQISFVALSVFKFQFTQKSAVSVHKSFVKPVFRDMKRSKANNSHCVCIANLNLVYSRMSIRKSYLILLIRCKSAIGAVNLVISKHFQFNHSKDILRAENVRVIHSNAFVDTLRNLAWRD